MRILLIGGTSHVGKSTIAQAIADKLGFDYMSTDKLARHPGRPWPTPPPHVIDHYRSHTTDELITSLMIHYEKLWPHIEHLIKTYKTGLILEGSGIWPDHVAKLTVPNTAAIWLTADNQVIQARVHTASHYETATNGERHLIDQFLARTQQYQKRMLAAINKLGLDHVETSHQSVTELVDTILATKPIKKDQTQESTPQSTEYWS
jgi:2-phosphoglycerate kinase